MSSTISDLFYGSKQNLLDNYLLRRDDTPKSIQSIYSIILSLNLGKISSGVYLVKAQMGNREIGDYFELGRKKSNELSLCFMGVSAIFIEDHTNIRIQITFMHKKMQAFIPMQVLKGIMNKVPPGGTHSKEINLAIKGSQKFIEKAQCKITLQSQSQRVLESGFMQRSLSGLKSQSKSHEYSDYIRQNYDKSSQSKISIQRQIKEMQIKPVQLALKNILLKNSSPSSVHVKVEGEDEKYEINDKITIKAYNRNGVNLLIFQQEEQIGIVHLNIVLLLSNSILGDFPINNQSNNCVGILALEHSQRKGKAEEIVQKVTYEKQETFHQQQDEIINFIIHSSTIYFIKGDEQILISKEKPLLLIRVGNEVVSHHENIVVQACQHYTNLYKMQINQPILISQIEGYDNSVEIEVYLGYNMIGYGKIVQNKDEKIIYDDRFVNTSTNSFISNAFIQYICMKVEPNYLLPHTYQNALPVFVDSQILSSNSHQMSKQILEKYQNLIYVESCRLTELLLQSNLKIKKLVKTKTVLDERLFQQMMYLDHKMNGIVEEQDLKQLIHFYSLGNTDRWKIDDNKILYLFMLAGVQVIDCINKDHEKKEQIQIDKKQIINKEQEKKLQIILPTAAVLIRQIVCQNMQKLMKQEQIPSIKISLGGKIQYRNANPTFLVNKRVNEGEEIIFYHHSIKDMKDIEICRITYQRQRIWEIGDAKIKIIT